MQAANKCGSDFIYMTRLVYFTKEDFPQLIRWINSENLLKHWAGDLFRFPLNEDSLSWYLEDTNVPGVSEAFIFKAVEENGKVVGHISLGGLSQKNRSARISRVFVESRGKGICQEMVQAVLQFGFEELKLHRISLGVYDGNPSAVRCYEKSGFRIEGINRDVFRYQDEWWSMIEMGILEHEWSALQREVQNREQLSSPGKI